MGNKF